MNLISTQVLERSSNDPEIGDVISGVYRLCFLEGPWLLALSHRGSDFRILVFNTPLPQQDPRSLRILELPALTRGCYLFLPRYGESLAGCPEFSVDPARRIFAVLLPRWAIVISVGPFIRGMSSVRASPYLQWGDWGEYAIKTRFHSNSSNPNIFGTKVLVLDSRTRPKTFLVEIYDLGEDVQRLIQRSDEGYGGVLLTPRWTATFQKGEPPKRAYFLGDKLVCFYVSLHMFKTARPKFNLALDRGGPWLLVKSIIYASGKSAKCGFRGEASELGTKDHGRFGPYIRSCQSSPMNSAGSGVSLRARTPPLSPSRCLNAGVRPKVAAASPTEDCPQTLALSSPMRPRHTSANCEILQFSSVQFSRETTGFLN